MDVKTRNVFNRTSQIIRTENSEGFSPERVINISHEQIAANRTLHAEYDEPLHKNHV